MLHASGTDEPEVITCAGKSLILALYSDRGGWLTWTATPTNPLKWFDLDTVYAFLGMRPDASGEGIEGLRRELRALDEHWQAVTDALSRWPELIAFESDASRRESKT